MNTPTRPVLRWHGGKWKLAPWVISYFPRHRIYVEPFGGAASVLMRKEQSYAEIYNDLDHQVVNLFRVLRNPGDAHRLWELLRLTPFARAEFDAAKEAADDPIEKARRLVVRAFMGFGSNAHSSSPVALKTGFKTNTRPDVAIKSPSPAAQGRGDLSHKGRGKKEDSAEWSSTGFRANSNRSGTTPAHDWQSYPAALPAIIDRLRGVIIESRAAQDVMRQHDGADTLHYADPPYLPETRSPANKYDLKHRMYRHELSADDHRALLDLVRGLKGYVVLSGYPSDLYERALTDWRRVECAAFADGARPRREVLWLNQACAAALDRQQRMPAVQIEMLDAV